MINLNERGTIRVEYRVYIKESNQHNMTTKIHISLSKNEITFNTNENVLRKP